MMGEIMENYLAYKQADADGFSTRFIGGGTREAAIIAYREHHGSEPDRTAEQSEVSGWFCIPAAESIVEDFLESVARDTSEDTADAVDPNLKSNGPELKELDDFLQQWFKKYFTEPFWFELVNVEHIA
jgi:hypothetical protein